MIENWSEITLRPFRGAEDFYGMAAAHRASSEADGIESTLTAEDLERGFRHLVNCDPHTDLVIAEVDGEIVGFTRGFWWDDRLQGRVYQMRGSLIPNHRRRGIGAAMHAWMEDRMRAVASRHSDAPDKYFLSGGVAPGAPGEHALFRSSGYEVFRYYHALVRPHLDDIPDFPLIDEFEVRPAVPEDYRAIWKNVEDSSRDEWPSYDLTEDDYQAWLSNPHFQPELWQIAWDRERGVPIGHVLTFIDHAENEEYGRKRGYTEGIGVDPAWRRRGIAKALISLSLKAQREAGMTESALAADAGSSNEVTRLYESCGFVIESTDIFYRKRMTA